MDLPPRPADDALAQPTRARLFAALGELRRPVGTEELAQRLSLHPNGVRLHLERLSQAGLVVRERDRQARGRPRDVWTISPDAQPGGDPPTAYANLGHWLARLVSVGRISQRRIEANGRDLGRKLAPKAGTASPEAKLRATLVSMGFQPQRRVGKGGGLTYRLGNCPYREAARNNQDVVCTLHRGITQGLLDVIGPETELVGFVPKKPFAAGCLIELRGGLADEA